MIHYNLVDEPVTDVNYRVIAKNSKPELFLGCRIRHKYDEDRLSFNTDLGVESVRVGNTFLKALAIPHLKSANIDLLHEQLRIVDDARLTNNLYEKTLKAFDLSSSECYSYRSTGVYPINGECYKQVCDTDKSIEWFYENIFKRSDSDCAWQGYAYLTLFILINKS